MCIIMIRNIQQAQVNIQSFKAIHDYPLRGKANFTFLEASVNTTLAEKAL